MGKSSATSPMACVVLAFVFVLYLCVGGFCYYFFLKDRVLFGNFPKLGVFCVFPVEMSWAVFRGLCPSAHLSVAAVETPHHRILLPLMWEFVSPSRWQKGGLVNLYPLEISH